jgi:hypothetical protein
MPVEAAVAAQITLRSIKGSFLTPIFERSRETIQSTSQAMSQLQSNR